MFFRLRHPSNLLTWKLQLFPEWYPHSIIHHALVLGIGPFGQLPVHLQGQVNLKTKKFLEWPNGMFQAVLSGWFWSLGMLVSSRDGKKAWHSCASSLNLCLWWLGHSPFVCTFCKKCFVNGMSPNYPGAKIQWKIRNWKPVWPCLWRPPRQDRSLFLHTFGCANSRLLSVTWPSFCTLTPGADLLSRELFSSWK